MKSIKIVSLLLALAMLLSFTACGQKEAAKTTEPAKTATEPAETAEPAETTEPATEATTENEWVFEDGFKIIFKLEEGETTWEYPLSNFQEGATMLDLFKNEDYKGEFNADLTEGDFVMVNSLEGLTPDAAKNEYIAIYSTDTTTPGIVDVNSEYTTTVEYKGVTYYSTQVGVADLPLVAGESYLFQIATF